MGRFRLSEREAIKAWREVRKQAGLQIDPATAEVTWEYAQTLDPYGIIVDLPREAQQVGREYFARSPGSDLWVSFDDLPDATREALRGKDKPPGSTSCLSSASDPLNLDPIPDRPEDVKDMGNEQAPSAMDGLYKGAAIPDICRLAGLNDD